MSAKNLDKHNRFRSRQVAFRLSPEEADLLDTYVRLSGYTKQDYITNRLLNKDIVVQGNPRVYKALRDQMDNLIIELQRFDPETAFSPEFAETIQFVLKIMDGLRLEQHGRR